MIKYGLLFAAGHFGLLVLAIYGSFTIFKGPSTPSEVFWDHVAGVLLFPMSLLIEIVNDDLIHALLMGLNSLIWGTVLAFSFQACRKFKAR
jgi:hypothetical protein